jgi:methyl-accepting chemotaxis protein
MNKLSGATHQINSAIDHVVRSAQSGAEQADQAAGTARNGARTVEDTIRGMDNIKAKVDISTGRVREMGQSSAQIGNILETIDNIASQTNLLALNAAIEAARAGEHGKGFAVVADEVRQLAEKSATATKEITELVRSIQRTINEAVQAMDEGAAEVDMGVERAHQANTALSDILRASEAVSSQTEEIVKAAKQMGGAAQAMVGDIETVSAVVQENTASTEEMAAGATEVKEAVENIASLGRENSVSIENVSVSARELSIQGEEVMGAAAGLRNMAQQLSTLVGRFKIQEDSTPFEMEEVL